MLKVKLMENSEVAELVAKKVAQTEATAAKNAVRAYKNALRTVREAIKTSGLDNKTVKGLTAHVVTALAEHAPATEAAAE